MQKLALAFLCTLLAGIARAEQSVTVGPWEVHYSALSTAGLDPTVARNYGITRSRNRVMLNVAVFRNDERGRISSTAGIEAAASNLNGQRRTMGMRRVEEGEAIYYLGFTRVADRETLSFTLSVTPEGADRPIEIRFEQQFFAN